MRPKTLNIQIKILHYTLFRYYADIYRTGDSICFHVSYIINPFWSLSFDIYNSTLWCSIYIPYLRGLFLLIAVTDEVQKLVHRWQQKAEKMLLDMPEHIPSHKVLLEVG